MRNLIFTTLILLSINTFAQWTTEHFVDEFGDKTEQTYKNLIAKGTFSNSATQNSELLGRFVWQEDKESLYIAVLEYGRSLATNTKSTFTWVKIKDPEGKVHTIKNAFFANTGYVLFEKKRYKQLIEIIQNPGEYTMVFSYYSTYSTSNYKLKFEL